MPNYRLNFELQVVDINGDTAAVTFNSVAPDSFTVAEAVTEVNDFATLIAAVTNGKVIRQRFGILADEAQLLVGTTPPNEAEYSKVETGARIQFSNSDGARASLTVPAPILAVFSAAGNANTVNPTQAGMANLITFLKLNMLDDGGTPLNLYQGGVRVSRHARRRPNRRI